MCSVSLDDDGVTFRVRWDAPQPVGAAVFEDQGDGLRQTLLDLSLGSALAVGARDLWAVCDVPIAILLDDRGELVARGRSYDAGGYPLGAGAV